MASSSSSGSGSGSGSGRPYPYPLPPTVNIQKFTPEMQDRQARNKDPYTGKPVNPSTSDEEGSGGASSSPQTRKPPRVVSAADDAFESRQTRRWTSAILNNPELLQLHAISRNDSVPATQYHFTKILCGYDDWPRSEDRRAAAAKKEREKRRLSTVNYKSITGAFEL